MKKIAITGSSGFLGKAFIRKLRADDSEIEILGIDWSRPASDSPDHLLRLDIRDRRVVNELVNFAPDAIVHLAFVLKPLRTERIARQIHLRGFHNVLEAASKARTARLMLGSSATVYGAKSEDEHRHHEDELLAEGQKLRYSADKVQLERLLKLFSWQHPSVNVTSIRPSLIGGRGADNPITRYLINMPFIIQIDGFDLPLQIAHVEDVARAMCEILKRKLSGRFNIAPDDQIRLSEIAKRLNKGTRKIPYSLVHWSTTVLWYSRVNMFETSPDYIPFSRFPWLIDSSRLVSECDFKFEFSSHEAFEQLLPDRFHV